MSLALGLILAGLAALAASAVIYLLLDWRYRARFERWRNEYATAISREAIKGSQAAISGRVLEKFAPYVPGFAWNPRDARFIGDPVDFVIFDGLSEGQLRRVVFLEVKSGAGALNGNERRVKAAVEGRSVEWQLFRLGEE